MGAVVHYGWSEVKGLVTQILVVSWRWKDREDQMQGIFWNMCISVLSV